MIRLTRLLVRNFGGVEYCEAKLGQVALITGRNGSGKTSLLNAVKTFFDGGSDPSCIRLGSEFAEVEIELSNGDTYNKVVKPTGHKLTGTNAAGGVIRAPATRLAELAPSLSFDPVAFLDADPKKRAEFLLANMPLTFTGDEISQACGEPGLIDATTVTLQQLNEIRQGRYDERTTINRRAEELNGAIQTMRRTLPDEADTTDWASERDTLTGRYSEIAGEIEAAGSKIAMVANEEKATKRQDAEAKIAQLKANLAVFLADVDTQCATALADATRELEAERAAIAERLGQAKEKAMANAKAEGVRSAIQETKDRQQGHILRGMALSAAIEKLDELKAERLRKLPIDGFNLTYDNYKRPVITIHGVPLDNLNRQQQLGVAMQAVTLASGALPLVLCECAELDDAHMAEIVEGMRESGFQLITARWDNDGALAVKEAA